MKPVPLTGYYAFVADRIRRGYMVPTAISRANKTMRMLPKHHPLAMQFGRFKQITSSERAGKYKVEPIELALANAYVTQFHRHLNGVVGHLASFALCDDTSFRGVIILGRPVARLLDDGVTVEVLRLCTDGSRNACSKLYGAARQFAKTTQKHRVITYTLADEPGASLKAAGFIQAGVTDGGSWSCPSRPRTDKAPTEPKIRWEMRIK